MDLRYAMLCVIVLLVMQKIVFLRLSETVVNYHLSK